MQGYEEGALLKGHEERLSLAALELGEAQADVIGAVAALEKFDDWAEGALTLPLIGGVAVPLTSALKQSIRAVLVQAETSARRRRNEAAAKIKGLV